MKRSNRRPPRSDPLGAFMQGPDSGPSAEGRESPEAREGIPSLQAFLREAGVKPAPAPHLSDKMCKRTFRAPLPLYKKRRSVLK